MDLQKTIEHFKTSESNVIIVTGPQRSGTTIASRILAEELGFDYIDEDFFQVWDFWLLESYLSSKQDMKFVVHAPGLFYFAHRIPDEYFVVVMFRDPPEIEASQAKIPGWDKSNDKKIRSLYKKEFPKESKAIIKEASLPRMQYCIFQFEQLQAVSSHGCILDYDSLSKHKLWIPKEDRRNFSVRQWR